MTYTVTNWIDGSTPLNRANMMKIENELALLDGGLGAPGAEIGYDQIIANVTVTSTTESAGTVVIAGSAHTFDGAPVIAEFFCPYFQPPSGASGMIICSLFEGATQVSRLAFLQSANAPGISVSGRLRWTPPAGSHTFSVTGFVANGASGVVGAGTGGVGVSPPSYLRFTKA